MKGTVPGDIRPAHPEPVEPVAVREKLLELLGLEEVPEKADFVIDSVKEEEGLVGLRGTFQNSLEEMVPAVLMMPGANAEPGGARCSVRTRDQWGC